MKFALKTLLVATLAVSATTAVAHNHGHDSALKHAVKATERNAERDQYRHPVQTLEFFGFKPSMTVVEIAPGGGWYSEILAPALKEHGTYYAAHFPADSSVGYYQRSLAGFKKKVAEDERFSKVKITEFAPSSHLDIAPAGSADMVLTFRNVHNWYMSKDKEAAANAFKSFYTALKSGGTLGVVEHRLPEERADEMQKSSGYMKQSVVIELAKKAGFELEASSDINANSLDTADHPKGVWTLPPSLRLGEQDAAKYKAIGESDRMTLKFKKPL
ncbi:MULTISPECIES: class I SAM-dependent methyltransferase [unclassified Pseudoalteromonas]|uniref:class I SAM-dependent methyltransferase n=1 Tax=unclassified Pseudoalteromonas TaxID=194690 RepID=UPI000B3C782E|nr:MULTISPECIES: class I SAM-dependent methyltransferase [unclassified Pseudoalteromonas]MDN3380106.1 class I SAM-dependent methyltransferase [Pseudoalteromonas sp. APC 3893]MDN3386679.1 class I SAM-dependent methyltransferase [Pseudoalteromonas sp. APC 4017]OUS70868.1 methyltransferase [Pseudoalteromonas sp. A601]